MQKQAIDYIHALCDQQTELLKKLRPSTIQMMQKDLNLQENGNLETFLEQFPQVFYDYVMRKKQRERKPRIGFGITRWYPLPADIDKHGDTLDCDRIFKTLSTSTGASQNLASNTKKIRKKKTNIQKQTSTLIKIPNIIKTTSHLVNCTEKIQQELTQADSIQQNIITQTDLCNQDPNRMIEEQKQQEKSNHQQQQEYIEKPQENHEQPDQSHNQQIPQIIGSRENKDGSEVKENAPEPRINQSFEPVIILDDNDEPASQMKEPNLSIAVCDLCKNASEFQMLKINNFFNCHRCILRSMNPLVEIVDVLCPSKLYQSQPYFMNRMESISIEFIVKDQFRMNPNIAMEIRCIQLSQQGMQECTFPQSCVMSFNGKQVKSIKPLQIKSSLHKRKDDINTVKNLQHFKDETHSNSFTIKQTMPEQNSRLDSPGSMYMFGLFLVKEKSIEQTIEEIVNEQKALDQNYFKNKIISPSHHGDIDEIQIELVKISLICQITYDLLDIPARGKYCAHLQCFSLSNFLQMMKKSEHKKWRCLVCKQVCYKFEIDKVQSHIIERFRALGIQHREISFQKNGEVNLTQEELDQIQTQKPIIDQIFPNNGQTNNQKKKCTEKDPIELD